MTDAIQAAEGVPLASVSSRTMITPQREAAETSKSQKIRDDFLKLLATQMSNQNPLEPMDNHDMTMQMASLSQLEQVENLSTTIMALQSSFDMVEGSKLIGMEVTFYPKDANGQPMDEAQTGLVTEMTVYDSKPALKVNGHKVPLTDVIGVNVPGGIGGDQQATIDRIMSYFPDEAQQAALENVMESMTPAQRQDFLDELLERAAELPADPTLGQFYEWLESLESVQNAQLV